MPSRDASRLINSAVDRLIGAGVRQRRALAKRLGTTTTDILALHYVVTAGESSPGELARALLLSPSGATSVIGRLSEAGLITRGLGAGKRRVVLVATDAGREVNAQALAPLGQDIGAMIRDLKRSDRVVLEQFLTRLADLVEREADALIAKAEADAQAATGVPDPVLWG
jgi:DNA-binding MarR family transcriptional regulator